MIQMVIEVCRIDDKPIEESKAYKLIEFVLGREMAKRLTYEITLPKDDA